MDFRFQLSFRISQQLPVGSWQWLLINCEDLFPIEKQLVIYFNALYAPFSSTADQ